MNCQTVLRPGFKLTAGKAGTAPGFTIQCQEENGSGWNNFNKYPVMVDKKRCH